MPTTVQTLPTSQQPLLLPEPGPSTLQEEPVPSTSHEELVPSTSQEAEQIPDGQKTSPIEDSLDKDILEILGEDPTVAEIYGKNIRPELAARFNHIATNGLNKDIRKELCEKYLLPENCKLIGAPILNDEVKAASNETVLKRDKLIEYRQKRLAAAISCLGEALSYALEAKDKDNAQIKRLMDTARLLCDAQYSDSVSRRTLAVSSLKKEMKDPLLNTKIDKSLFGENLTDSLKSAKAVSKSGSDLKNQYKPAPTKNWKIPVAGRRPPATPQGRRNTPATPTTPAQPTAPWPRTSSEPRGARTQSSRRPPPPPPRSTRRRY